MFDISIFYCLQALNKLVKKEKTPILMMFYAPWCGHCKRLKPDYAAAATELKGQATLAGMDVDKPENEAVRRQFNITGFPTILYFEGGKQKYKYGGENNKQGIVDWMKDPQPPVEKAPEPEWSDVESDVVHLTDETFDTYMEDHGSVLVMFYAPWCGHCKKMKPEYDEAAATLKEENIDGVLAALDATKSPQVAKRFEVKGYPTVKYFKDGEEAFGFNDRTADKIVDFMKDPKEPPPPPPPEQPWQDVESEVVHLGDEDFKSQLKRRKHALVMFYAPWCGHCKAMKPDYALAAKALKEDEIPGVLAAVDATVDRVLQSKYDITGFPTLKHFKDGEFNTDYNKGRNLDALVEFMKNPQKAPPPPPPEPEWSEVPSEVSHLTEDTFSSFIKEHDSVLVMFYAPWCGHCKKMKPAYQEAAEQLLKENPGAKLAAVDATKYAALGTKYEVRGYPTIKYFKNGEMAFQYNKGRTTDDIVAFMKDPKEEKPPPPEKEWSEEPSDVVHLTDATFATYTQEHSPVLVMFYAPWCGHCKRMKPAFEEAATLLKTEFPAAKLAAVDATQYRDVSSKYEVRGYPTLLYFKNGQKEFKYQLGRSTQELVKFMKNPQAPPPPPPPEQEWSEVPSEINHLTDQTFDSFVYRHSSVLVMFYAPWCGHCKRMKPAYQEAAEQLLKEKPEAKLAAVDATKYKELGQQYGVRGYPTLKYFKNGKVASDYNKGRAKDDIVAFMKSPQVAPPKTEEPPSKEAKPAAGQEDGWETGDVHHLTADSFNTFMQQHHSVLVMFYAPWCGHCKKMKPAYLEAAEQLKKEKPEAKLAAVDATQHGDLASNYGVRGYPTLKYFQDGKEAYNYKKGRTTSDLVSFMKDPQAPPPPPPPEPEWSEVPSEVSHLTEETFSSFMKEHDSVLVMFYAPWCGHCKKMKPAYQEAAETLKTAGPGAKLAAVDCTKYGALAKTYQVRGYPTIKYFRSGEEIQKYQGARDADSIVRFMTKPPTEAPPEWTEGPSAVVTPIKTIPAFDKFVQSHENTLVLFYKKELPKYTQAKGPFMKTAAAFRDDNSKEFAAVDCEAVTDLCMRVGIIPESLPTIKFYVNGKFSTNYKDPVTNVDLYNFMNAAGSVPVKTDNREEL
ncbi:PDIA5 [Branchiostoma lanceolatum]|uniref:protein disulfide-isomerase n=1 Tax=Branchiostoma lanceolatum TaxID=7740 RepID=A0A8J9YTV9_BRALA|nr:PDIA5 [Branchiostoma lanceolatum]